MMKMVIRLKFTRIKRKKEIINIISASSGELLALATILRDTSLNPNSPTMMIPSTKDFEKTLVLNDEIFDNIENATFMNNPSPLGYSMRKLVEAHIKKWDIKPKKEKKKNSKKYTKIEVE